jgi:hypothetical protein
MHNSFSLFAARGIASADFCESRYTGSLFARPPEHNPMSAQKQYVVVARARASAVFKQNDSYSLIYQAEGSPPARMVFRTRYIDRKMDHLIPEDLWVEIRGSAESIRRAMAALRADRIRHSALSTF